MWKYEADGSYRFEPKTQIGDMRVSWSAVAPEVPVSLIAVQRKDGFAPYFSHATHRSVDLLFDGDWSAEGMFEQAHANLVALTWFLRIFGFVVMFIGLLLITDPLKVLASVLPLLGHIVGAVSGIIGFVLSLMLTLGTIAVAWLFYRPLLGCVLLAVALLLLITLVRYNKAKARAAA